MNVTSRQRSPSPDKVYNFKTPVTSRKVKIDDGFHESKMALTQSVDFRKKPVEADPYEFVKQIKAEDRVWFWNSHPDHQIEKTMKPFDDITCMTLERILGLYRSTKDEEYRLVNIGFGLTVDLENWIMYNDNDANNQKEQRQVMRSDKSDGSKKRNIDQQRYSSPITAESLKSIREAWCR
jgi:hypothetical protein